MKPIAGVVAAILLALLVIPGSAQRNPTQTIPRFRTGVELVLLDVSALDRERMPVHGLSAQDFTILEDGRPQKIESFSEVELPDVVRTLESRAPWVRDVVPDVQKNTDLKDARIVVIAMDDATPRPAADIPPARALARRAIEQLGPGDLAAVVFALDKKSGQEFTTDRSRLLAAVDRFNGATDLKSFEGFDRFALTLYLAAVDALKGVSEYLIDLPQRRKALIWVSVGVPIDWDMAQPALISLESPESATTSGAVYAVVKAARELLEAARRANVNIYGLDPGGLRAPSPRYDALSGTTTLSVSPAKLNRDFLQGVSASSGGFAVVDTNDPVPGIMQVFRENGSYYLLGYAASNTRAEGRFRKIEVRVNRPDITVRARNGYFEPRPAKVGTPAATATTPTAVDEALAEIIPKSDLTMQVSAAAFAVPGRPNAAVAIILGIHQPAPLRATRAVQRIDLQVAAYGPDGKRRAGRRELVEATLNTPGIAAGIGYETFTRLDLPPGRYQLRLAAESSLHGIRLGPRAPEVGLVARDESTVNRSGSVYYDVDVPEFLNARLTLSGMLLSVSPPVASGPKDRLASLVPVIPTTLRDFTASDQVTAFLRIYQGGKADLVPVAVSVHIIDSNGAEAFATMETLNADRFAKSRAADYFLDVPIARLKGGPHLLTVEANTGGKTARRDVRFEVR